MKPKALSTSRSSLYKNYSVLSNIRTICHVNSWSTEVLPSVPPRVLCFSSLSSCCCSPAPPVSFLFFFLFHLSIFLSLPTLFLIFSVLFPVTYSHLFLKTLFLFLFLSSCHLLSLPTSPRHTPFSTSPPHPLSTLVFSITYKMETVRRASKRIFAKMGK